MTLPDFYYLIFFTDCLYRREELALFQQAWEQGNVIHGFIDLGDLNCNVYEHNVYEHILRT